MALKLGRDGSVMKARSSRMQIAERTIAYRRFDIYGRSLVDTWMLAQHYDIASRELEGFGLEEIERHLKLVHPGRVYVEPERVSELVANDPATLRGAALDNARQIANLTPSELRDSHAGQGQRLDEQAEFGALFAGGMD